MLDYWTINSKLRKSFPMSTFILFCLSLYLFKPFALATKQFHVEYSVVKLILQLSENKVFGWGWNKKKMATNYHVNEIRILFFVSVCVCEFDTLRIDNGSIVINQMVKCIMLIFPCTWVYWCHFATIKDMIYKILQRFFQHCNNRK